PALQKLSPRNIWKDESEILFPILKSADGFCKIRVIDIHVSASGRMFTHPLLASQTRKLAAVVHKIHVQPPRHMSRMSLLRASKAPPSVFQSVSIARQKRKTYKRQLNGF